MPIRPRSSQEEGEYLSRERAEGGSREGRRARREGRDRPSDVAPAVDRGSAIPDAALIEAARARALASGSSTEDRAESDEGKTAFNYGWKRVKTGRPLTGGILVLGGCLTAFSYLSYQTSRPVLFTVAHALDWIGQKMNSWADKLIDKKLPILSWLVNPLVSLIDKSAKSLGIDKTLAEHLKKNAEDRKKLAEKVFKDYMETQKRAEKQTDDASAKTKRRKVIEEKLGPDVAAVILDDVDAAAAAALVTASPKADTTPATAPAETLKAA